MTWPQITEIVFHERDEHGSICFKPQSPTTEEERFRSYWKGWGLTEEQLDHKWAEFIQTETHRYGLEMSGMPLDKIDTAMKEFTTKMVRERKWGR